MEGMQIKGECPGASERGTEGPRRAQGMDAAVFEHSHYCFITEKNPPEEQFSFLCIAFGLFEMDCEVF